MKNRTCIARTKFGKKCRAGAIANSDYCINHDPNKKAEMSAKNKTSWSAYLTEKDVGAPPKSRQDLVVVIAETIQHVRTNRLDPNRGKCVAELCRVAYRFMGSQEIEADQRTKELEKMSTEQLIEKISEMKKNLGVADA